MKQKLIISAMIIKLIKSLILKQLHIDHYTLKINFRPRIVSMTRFAWIGRVARGSPDWSVTEGEDGSDSVLLHSLAPSMI